MCLRMVLLLAATLLPVSSHAADARPNIVVILGDDVRWDDVGYAGNPVVKTPHIDRIAKEGAVFRQAFATTPLCSPSRACFLTGLYAHTHGIIDNTDRSARSHQLTTFPRLLHDAGYTTAYIGKWHMGVDDSPRPGFDHWVSVRGQGQYLDPELNVDGVRSKTPGYATDIFNARAVDFLRRRHDKPFLLYLAHKAVHPSLHQNADGSVSDPLAATFVPAERHRQLYREAAVPRRPNVKDNLEGKPALLRKLSGLPPLSENTGTSDDVIRDRWRMLAAVDDGVGDILHTLETAGQLDNTLVIFTSDHGYFYGEHGLSVERRLAYEETIRIPLAMRWPKRIKPSSQIDAMALSIDLAPTVLELAGVKPPSPLPGRSLTPLWEGKPVEWRTSFLIEHFSDKVFQRVQNMGYQAIRTERWKYIHYTDLPGMDELYDLVSDPYEMRNQIDEPGARDQLGALKAEMQILLK